MDQRLQMLKDITDAPGVPGAEQAVRKVIETYMAPYAEITKDRLGSIVCKKEGSALGPRIMLAGHMDEIGFFVHQITKEGFIRFLPLGGWWDQVMLAQRVIIKTSKGEVPGIIGSKPPHILSPEERNKVVRKDTMFIDVGAADEVEAMETFGIKPGDPIIPDSPFTIMKNPKYIMAKAWDDRVGCALFMDVIKRLQEEDHPNTVFGVGTVQEEVGLRGATTSVNLVKPDIGIALETGIAGDIPGADTLKASEKLGKGPVIVLYDGSMVPHAKFRDLVLEVAKAEGIPIQFDAMTGGGTDAGRIHVHNIGVPSLVIGVPTRYIHSHAGIIHRDDYDQTVDLLVAVIKRLDEDTLQALLD